MTSKQLRHSVVSLYPQRRGTREKTTEFGICTYAVSFDELRSGDWQRRKQRKRNTTSRSVKFARSSQLVGTDESVRSHRRVRTDSHERFNRSKHEEREEGEETQKELD